MRRVVVLAVSAVLAFSLLVPGQADAVPGLNEVWTAAFSYVPHLVVLQHGQTLKLTNMDLLFPHNVTALVPQLGAFFSLNAAPGDTVPVNGTNTLPTGAYPFSCTVDILHVAAPTLKGILVVV